RRRSVAADGSRLRDGGRHGATMDHTASARTVSCGGVHGARAVRDAANPRQPETDRALPDAGRAVLCDWSSSVRCPDGGRPAQSAQGRSIGGRVSRPGSSLGRACRCCPRPSGIRTGAWADGGPGSACHRQAAPEKGLATPSITLSHDKVSLGSPIDITYKFVVAPDAPRFTENYRVFAGVVDADDQLMWTDDHNPPTPTTEWEPNQTITYTRTVFIPVYPYVGEAAIHMGLYSTNTQKRLPLKGPHIGQ